MRSKAEPGTAERVTELSPVTLADAELLGNLIQLYIHDLSPIFTQMELGPTGRYGYPDLQQYLAGAGGKSGYIIRHGGRVAGFILVRRGSPFGDDPDVLDIAEFFVLRRFRGQGLGREAVECLWRSVRGRWMVRAAVKNHDAVAFWHRVVTIFTHDGAEESERTLNGTRWAVFAFDSGDRSESAIPLR